MPASQLASPSLVPCTVQRGAETEPWCTVQRVRRRDHGAQCKGVRKPNRGALCKPGTARFLLAEEAVEALVGDGAADDAHDEEESDVAEHGPVEDAKAEAAEKLGAVIER